MQMDTFSATMTLCLWNRYLHLWVPHSLLIDKGDIWTWAHIVIILSIARQGNNLRTVLWDMCSLILWLALKSNMFYNFFSIALYNTTLLNLALLPFHSYKELWKYITQMANDFWRQMIISYEIFFISPPSLFDLCLYLTIYIFDSLTL